MENRKEHWNKIFVTKQAHEVSWTQTVPTISLDFIQASKLSKDASIIDIGGGDSTLVDFLIEDGYTNITVLDISEEAIQKTQKRLGAKATETKWIVSDISDFKPKEQYDFWHDRAAFHFLTSDEQISKYMNIAKQAVHQTGYMSICTFSTTGPQKCSGLEIKQYSEATLAATVNNGFEKIKCVNDDHVTPFNTVQNFIYCYFKKIVAPNV